MPVIFDTPRPERDSYVPPEPSPQVGGSAEPVFRP